MGNFIEKRKRAILFLLLISCILLIYLLCMEIFLPHDEDSTFTISGNSNSYESLLINTYLKKITEASDNFYKEYYTISPSINYYSVSLKEVSGNDSISYVTFQTTPYLGAHNTIGIDEITFSADYTGIVTLDTFHHIVSYPLPEHLKDLEKTIID